MGGLLLAPGQILPLPFQQTAGWDSRLRKIRRVETQVGVRKISRRAVELDLCVNTVFAFCGRLPCRPGAFGTGTAADGAARGAIGEAALAWTPAPVSFEEELSRIQKRVNTGDPEAIRLLGESYMNGINGLEKDMLKAVEVLERAAELGEKEAHGLLGELFDENTDDWGIDKDMAGAVGHYEFAAKRGHALSRHNLGFIEHNKGTYGLARKHLMISAKLGFKPSLDEIKNMHRWGIASKSDHADALRGYNDAVEEMSSPERDEAKAYWREIDRNITRRTWSPKSKLTPTHYSAYIALQKEEDVERRASLRTPGTLPIPVPVTAFVSCHGQATALSTLCLDVRHYGLPGRSRSRPGMSSNRKDLLRAKRWVGWVSNNPCTPPPK
ncbi:hypothetical protein THAOC_35632 [Thalassiosira oceanica]|uniref:Uncharacterized protein n=1 Tax=Thalassiosira oceanica TaxID=159749 RepID=K0R0M0_THAOC|nr:hypothetical protein THAOC_35632 [Thalassiosira oceanica]|eukprot:EJK45738.1 hypothetical protein THAOC_35632 [Thalassiosira oceanica]